MNELNWVPLIDWFFIDVKNGMNQLVLDLKCFEKY